jgi:hypothetical protein
MLHPTFPGLVVAKGIEGFSKVSHNTSTPRLLGLCREGEHMLEVTQAIKAFTLVMHYESKHQPQITTLDDACKFKLDGERIWILWECH